MRFTPVKWWVAAALSVWMGACLAADGDFEARLQQADRIRSGDQQVFSRLVDELESDAAGATTEQRQRLGLLQAYRFILSGKTAASIGKLEELLAGNPDPTLRYRAGALLANNYAIAGRFVEGVSTMEQTLAQTGAVRDKEARHQVLTTAAILYNQMGQFKLGLDYADQVLAEGPGARLRCFTQNLRLESLQRLDQGPPESVFEAAIDDCVEQNEQIVAGFGRTYYARSLHDLGQLNRAISLLESHLPELRATQYPRVLAEVYSLLAQYQFEAGSFKVAKNYAEQTIGQGAQPLALSVAQKVLYEIALREGDEAKALLHYRAYAESDKTHLNEVNAREMAYQLVRQELRQKSQQITLLNRQNQVLQLQRQVDRQAAINMQVLAGLLLLLTSAIGYWAYRVKRMEHVLRAQAEIDSLTGVCSRQHFHKQATRLLEACAGRRSSAAMVMFDLDHFKDFNDRYGHDIGDWVLRRAAEACRGTCRPGDLIGRLGGEEFAMLLVDVRHDGAVRVAEACRQAIQEIDSTPTGISLRPSASFGVSMTSDSDYDLVALLSHADKALYRAKHAGRNCVRTYDDVAHPSTEAKADAGRPSLRLLHSATPQEP